MHQLAGQKCYGCRLEKAGVHISSQEDHMNGGCLSEWFQKMMLYSGEALHLLKNTDWERDIKIAEPDIDWLLEIDFAALTKLLAGNAKVTYNNICFEIEMALENEQIVSDKSSKIYIFGV